MNWQFYGPDAVLVRFADAVGDEAFRRGRAICRELETNPPAAMREFVPAFTTVLIEFASASRSGIAMAMDAFVKRFEAAVLLDLPPRPVKEVRVTYDGADLQRVAGHARLSVEEVVRLHSAPIYKVYMLGFSPGFPYLGELDPRLHTPRLKTPRPVVPAGSVAIGGEHTGIYSVDSPGGWNLIGRTTVRLVNVAAALNDGATSEKIFLLEPGDRVRFVPE